MAKPVFQVLRSLLDLSRIAFLGKKKCPGEVIQHYSTRWHCIGLRKVCIHDFTVWSSTTGNMDWNSWTNLLGFEEPCGIRGRVSSTGGKVLRWSQWTLLPTTVCPENVYLWFDPVKLAKVLTGIHERAGFPGLEELFPAYCQWLSCNAFTLGHFWYLHCIPWPRKCGFWCTICHAFDILDHLILRFSVDAGHLGKWRRVWIACISDDVIMQFRDPTPQWLISDMQTNAGIRLPPPVRSSFWGLCCSTTILSVLKICIYASQNYTLLMFNGTHVLKVNKNYIYDVTQYVTKYVVTDRFA